MKIRTALVWSERPELIPELATACRAADSVEAVVIGPEKAADGLVSWVDRVWWAPVEAMEARQRGAILEQVIGACEPELVVAAATRSGIETLAHLAQRLGLPCPHACASLELEAGEIVVTRSRYGRFVAQERLAARPALLTVTPCRFSPVPVRKEGDVRRIEVSLPPPTLRVLERRFRQPSARDIAAARAIVSVGRGLKRREDLALIEQLAQALCASVGASRPVADYLQWLPVDVKVGLSGRTVRPDLYVACGISGQCEHVVGMRESRVVVSINLDPDAPIHAEADYAIIGDLYAVIPALLSELAMRRLAGARSVRRDGDPEA